MLTGRRKIPDLVDFAIGKNIGRGKITAIPIIDLSSDHTPTIFELTSDYQTPIYHNKITNKLTNWGSYKKFFDPSFNKKVRLQSTEDIDNCIMYRTDEITKAGQRATPVIKNQAQLRNQQSNDSILNLIKDKMKCQK